MTWIVIALVGYCLLAATFILDKHILSNTTIKHPSVYAFYSSIILFGALVLLLFQKESFPLSSIYIGLFSGIGFGLGLLTLYRALKGGEASHVTPFNGAMVTLSTYTLSNIFLSETIALIQFLGIIFLAGASILLSYQETKKQKGYSASYLFAILSGIFFAVSHVSAKYLYTMHEFIPAFAWSRAGAGIVGLLLLFHPHVRRELRERFGTRKTTQAKKKPETSLLIVWITKVIGITAVILIQYAGALGSVTVVQAMSGLQYALMFAVIYILSKWFPKVFREYFSNRELAIQLAGIILVTIGSLFLLNIV